MGIVVVICGFVVAPSTSCCGESKNTIVAKSAAVKVTHLYLTAKYVAWPNESMETTAPFVIGVLGQDALAGNLEKLAKIKKVHDRPIEIRRFRNASDYRTCHMVYIPLGTPAEQVMELTQRTANQPVILWRDENNPEWPSTSCNFVIEDESILIEIDPAELKRRGMVVQAQFLSLNVVRTRRATARSLSHFLY